MRLRGQLQHRSPRKLPKRNPRKKRRRSRSPQGWCIPTTKQVRRRRWPGCQGTHLFLRRDDAWRGHYCCSLAKCHKFKQHDGSVGLKCRFGHQSVVFFLSEPNSPLSGSRSRKMRFKVQQAKFDTSQFQLYMKKKISSFYPDVSVVWRFKRLRRCISELIWHDVMRR
jgi:hypothetical protein